jgi:hypothetical protein
MLGLIPKGRPAGFTLKNVVNGARMYHTIKREYGLPLYAHEKSPSEVTISLSKDPKAVPVGTLKESMKSLTSPRREYPSFRPVRPSQFESDPNFSPLLWKVLENHVHECSMFQSFGKAEAKSTTFFSVYDFRNPPTYGRIPDVEDIFGTVRLDASGIVKNSFERNTMYRPATTTGFIQLTDHLHEKLRSACETN